MLRTSEKVINILDTVPGAILTLTVQFLSFIMFAALKAALPR